MRFSAIVLALSVAASAAASPILEKRIIGGSPAGKNEIPFIVEFRNKFKKCTGFLINPQTVMTAAHCLSDPVHTGFVYGSVDVGKGKSLDWAEFVQHPQYNRSHEHDIGLVFLNNKAAPSSFANINTPAGSYPKTDSRLSAAGYGVIKVGNGDDIDPVYPKVLHKVDVTIASKADCKKHSSSFLGDYQFCASDKPLGHGVCNGDSGGPVSTTEGKTRYVVGLVNHGVAGIDCGTKGSYQYFTYIKPYIGWVNEEYKRFKKDGPRTK